MSDDTPIEACMTDQQRLALIRSHTLHSLKFTPESIHVHDKLFLIRMIDDSKPTFDYRSLLARYIAMVTYAEGTDFLGPRGCQSNLGPFFNDEEATELRKVADEAITTG